MSNESAILVTVGGQRLRVPFPSEWSPEEEQRSAAAAGRTVGDAPAASEAWRAMLFVARERAGLPPDWISPDEEAELIAQLQTAAVAKLARLRIPRGRKRRKRR